MTRYWRWPTAFVLLLATLALPGFFPSFPFALLLANGLQLRLDELSLFFVLLVALATLWPAPGMAWRCLVMAVLCALGFALTDMRLVALCYGLAGLVLWNHRQERAGLALALALLPPLLLLVAAVQLGQLAGSPNYSLPAAASGLSSAGFAATLLATVLALAPISAATSRPQGQFVLQLAWCYPLLRLVAVGPWNWGWHVALLALALALLFHATWQALRQQGGSAPVYIALALAGVGTGTAVGVAAALVALLLAFISSQREKLAQRHSGTMASHVSLSSLAFASFAPLRELLPRWAPLLLTATLPLTLPFVSLWLLLAALLGRGWGWWVLPFWLWGLGFGAAQLRAWFTRGEMQNSPPVPMWAAMVSLLAGVLAPLWMPLLLRPVLLAMQPGLEREARALWPWSALLAPGTTVDGQASLALLGLLLVGTALSWLMGWWLARDRNA